MPDNSSTSLPELFTAAVRHHQGGRFADAEQLYEQIVRRDPHHADALHLCGVLAHQTGRQDAAATLIGRAILENNRMPAFHNNLGNVLKAQGRLEEADASYRNALTLKPDYFEAYYNLGLLRQTLGRFDEAAACYEKVLAYKPDHAEAYNNLGNALQAQGKLDQALAAYGRALSYKPGFSDAYNNAANIHRAMGHAEAAIANYTQALQLQPNHTEALHNLGIVLLDEGRLEEAAAASRRALALDPHHSAAHVSLGNTLTEQGDTPGATACFRRALELDPNFAEAALGLATAVIPVFARTFAEAAAATGDFSRALDALTIWDRAHPERLGSAVGSHQPFYLAYRPTEVDALLARYGDLVSAAAAAHWRPRPPDRPARDVRLRLIVVSGQVRQHPVWDVILRGLIAHLDRSRFDIRIYHTGALQDAETEWAKQRVDRFVQGLKPVKGWLDELDHDRPDILFYPELGMDPAACALAALRLAPVQVAGWGHPVTTGLPTIDIFLSGELIEGPEAAEHYRERLVCLPGTGVCTDSSGLRAGRWDAPARPTGAVRFALCLQPIKFDPTDDELLVRIAQEAGHCEFWFASPVKNRWAGEFLHHRLTATFRKAGLDPGAHLRVTPWLPRDRFLGFLDEMDVYLDGPSFSGYTTTWQAVHRGLPVVTLEGRFLRQRLAAGLLRQIGKPEGIVASREAYIETAVRFARGCLAPVSRDRRRESMRAAAPRADGNLAAVRSVERTLIDAVEAKASFSRGQ